MKSLLVAAAAPIALALAKGLRRRPVVMKKVLVFNRDYIDWRCRNMVCRTTYGATFECNLRDFIQRKIAYFGVWEPNLTNYMKRVLGPGDVLVDVGANIGYYSLLGWSIVGKSGTVVAIEASPKIYALLKQNLARNGASTVRAVNVAASDARGTASVYMGHPSNCGTSSITPRRGNTFDTTVDALPLHEILTTHEMTRTKLIKIDIEGAEGPVIKSILKNLDFFNPKCELAIEVSPDNPQVLTELMAAGFCPYLLENIYSDKAYLYPTNKRPERFTGKLERMSDFIFSRIDASYL